jgi:hypothetical protein
MKYIALFLRACTDVHMGYLVLSVSACAEARMKYLSLFVCACAETHRMLYFQGNGQDATWNIRF